MDTPSPQINLISKPVKSGNDENKSHTVLENQLAELIEEAKQSSKTMYKVMAIAGLFLLPCVPYGWLRQNNDNLLDFIFIPLLFIGSGFLFYAGYLNKKQVRVRIEMHFIQKNLKNLETKT